MRVERVDASGNQVLHLTHINTCKYIVKLHLAHPNANKLFTGYETDHVRVNGERFDGNIVVYGNEVHLDWFDSDFSELTEAHFDYFLNLLPEILLLGTGSLQRFVHPRLYGKLTNAGIGVECMDTPAACRTYNFLAEENRKVVVAILQARPVQD